MRLSSYTHCTLRLSLGYGAAVNAPVSDVSKVSTEDQSELSPSSVGASFMGEQLMDSTEVHADAVKFTCASAKRALGRRGRDKIMM
jgi:hypothetical protein